MKILLFSHSLNTGFFIFESYPLMNYLEYPFLVLQVVTYFAF